MSISMVDKNGALNMNVKQMGSRFGTENEIDDFNDQILKIVHNQCNGHRVTEWVKLKRARSRAKVIASFGGCSEHFVS